MTDVFMTVINMSATATLAASVVFIVRALLGKRIPRVFSYALWSIVFIRSVLPFSFPSAFSILDKVNPNVGLSGAQLNQTAIFGFGTDALPQQGNLAIQGAAVDAAKNLTSEAGNMVEPLIQGDHILLGCAAIWLLGIVCLCGYSMISYVKINRRIRTATRLQRDELIEECKVSLPLRRSFQVYVTDQIDSPFVWGILTPKIILPSFLLTEKNEEETLRYVLLHEMVHISRFDFILKPLAFLALTVHWFNPVMWISFYCVSKDVELSCDERVIKDSDTDQRGNYAAALLGISCKQNHLFAGGMLAFGESNISERVNNIVNYKNPKLWIIVVSVLLVVICGVFLLSDPSNESEWGNERISVLFMGACESESDLPMIVDSIVLMEYAPETRTLAIVPIPRETMLTSGGQKIKLGEYAAQNSSEAVVGEVNRMLGTDVSNYIRLDTSVFRDMIDILGGIEFDVPQDMQYDDPMQGLHIDLKKGMQTLDGNQAEMLVRFRKGYPEGNLTRMDVQADVITAILKQKSKGDLVKNIEALSELISQKAVTNMDKKQMMKYAAMVEQADLKKKNIKKIDLPISVVPESPSMVVMDEEKEEKMEGGESGDWLNSPDDGQGNGSGQWLNSTDDGQGGESGDWLNSLDNVQKNEPDQTSHIYCV